jgi:hypothetical protein
VCHSRPPRGCAGIAGSTKVVGVLVDLVVDEGLGERPAAALEPTSELEAAAQGADVAQLDQRRVAFEGAAAIEAAPAFGVGSLVERAVVIARSSQAPRSLARGDDRRPLSRRLVDGHHDDRLGLGHRRRRGRGPWEGHDGARGTAQASAPASPNTDAAAIRPRISHCTSTPGPTISHAANCCDPPALAGRLRPHPVPVLALRPGRGSCSGCLRPTSWSAHDVEGRCGWSRSSTNATRSPECSPPSGSDRGHHRDHQKAVMASP